MSYTLLNKKFSEEGVGLCEQMGLQPISELFTTDGGWAQVCRQPVPDDGGCNMEFCVKVNYSASTCDCNDVIRQNVYFRNNFQKYRRRKNTLTLLYSVNVSRPDHIKRVTKNRIQ